jgi:Integrase core domain
MGFGICHAVRSSRYPADAGQERALQHTLKREVIAGRSFADLGAVQQRFDAWLEVYNRHRPHQALGDEPPASRFREAARGFPARLAPIAYEARYLVRRVNGGRICIGGREPFVSFAFEGNPVGLLPGEHDGRFEVWYCRWRVGNIDLSGAKELDQPVHHVCVRPSTMSLC